MSERSERTDERYECFGNAERGRSMSERSERADGRYECFGNAERGRNTSERSIGTTAGFSRSEKPA
jgi:hypothetical protein